MSFEKMLPLMQPREKSVNYLLIAYLCLWFGKTFFLDKHEIVHAQEREPSHTYSQEKLKFCRFQTRE